MKTAAIHYQFRLYIAGEGPHSTLATANLRAVCKEYLADSYEIEVVDVLLEPGRALAEGIMLTPMLVKLAPAPTCKIVGNLSQRDILLQSLGLAT